MEEILVRFLSNVFFFFIENQRYMDLFPMQLFGRVEFKGKSHKFKLPRRILQDNFSHNLKALRQTVTH